MSRASFGRKIRKNILYIIAIAILAVIAAALAIYILRKIYNPVTTELALNYEVEDTVQISGLVFRTETVITYGKSGAFDYLVSDGERVGKGSTIAKVYDDAKDVQTEREIRKLSATAENLKNITSSGDVYVIGVDTIVRQITDGLCAIADCDGNSGIGDISDTVATLNDSITKKQLATGGAVDFSARINETEEKINQLKSSIKQKPNTVIAEKTGYFYKNCDGYEGAVDLNEITSMTISDFDAIRPMEIKENTIGKIADSYSWYYVFKTDAETAGKFSRESNLYARFMLVSSEKFKIKVETVKYEEDAALVILKSDYAIADMTSDRDQPLEIILNTYTGLRVDDRAIRIVDGVTGVYVQMGYEVKFRTVDIVYKTDEFAIVPASDKDEKLKLYDSVITKGEDLYDGKLLS